KPLFTDVNLKYQTVLLTMALMVVERHYASGYRATELYLQHLGHKHHQRAVPSELYSKWVESLLAALEKFHGPDSDAPAAGQRRDAGRLPRAGPRLSLSQAPQSDSTTWRPAPGQHRSRGGPTCQQPRTSPPRRAWRCGRRRRPT